MKQRLKLRGRAIIDAGDVIRIAIARDVASDDGLADRAADAVARSIAGAGIDPEYLTGDLSNVTYASYRAGRIQFNAYIEDMERTRQKARALGGAVLVGEVFCE